MRYALTLPYILSHLDGAVRHITPLYQEPPSVYRGGEMLRSFRLDDLVGITVYNDHIAVTFPGTRTLLPNGKSMRQWWSNARALGALVKHEDGTRSHRGAVEAMDKHEPGHSSFAEQVFAAIGEAGGGALRGLKPLRIYAHSRGVLLAAEWLRRYCWHFRVDVFVALGLTDPGDKRLGALLDMHCANIITAVRNNDLVPRLTVWPGYAHLPGIRVYWDRNNKIHVGGLTGFRLWRDRLLGLVRAIPEPGLDWVTDHRVPTGYATAIAHSLGELAATVPEGGA